MTQPANERKGERQARMLINIMCFAPPGIAYLTISEFVMNRYGGPTDSPDAGQGEGIIVGLPLLVLVSLAIALFSRAHTSPGSLLLKHVHGSPWTAVVGVAVLNLVLVAGAWSAYRAVAIDYPSARTVSSGALRQELLAAPFDLSTLPSGAMAAEVGAGAEVHFERTATTNSLELAIATTDGERSGTIEFDVRASSSEAKAYSRTWVSEHSFAPLSFEYPSQCFRNPAETQYTCLVRVGQTIVTATLHGVNPGERKDERLTVAVAQAGVEFLEAALQSLGGYPAAD